MKPVTYVSPFQSNDRGSQSKLLASGFLGSGCNERRILDRVQRLVQWRSEYTESQPSTEHILLADSDELCGLHPFLNGAGSVLLLVYNSLAFREKHYQIDFQVQCSAFH